MTGKGRYRDDFSAPPEPPLAPSSIGPRVLQTKHQGRTRTVVVDPTAFACGRLVAELAGAIADRHAALDLSWGVLQRAERAARSFADWIDANHERPRECNAAVLTVDDLERWQATLRTQHPADSDVPGELATSLFVTLRWLAEQTETTVAPDIAARVRAPVSFPRRRCGSVDELSPKDRQAIDAAARSGVERLKRSLSLSRSSTGVLGDALAAARRDALTPVWLDDRYGPTIADLPTELRSVLELHHIPVREDPEAAARRAARDLRGRSTTMKEVAAALNAEGYRTPQGLAWTASLARRLIERDPREWRADMLVGAIEGLIWPTEHALMPVVVLLGLRTGLPPECIKDLNTDCVTSSDSRYVTIEYVKRRGIGRSSLSVPNQGEFSASRLIDLVVAATEAVRPHVEVSVRPRLFVCRTRRAAGAAFRAADFQGEFARWCDRQGLEVEGPADLRRLRKTRKVARAMALKGSVTDIADDHTTQVARDHYLQTTTLQVLSAEVIRKVQRRITNEMADGPVVVPPDVVEEVMREAPESSDLEPIAAALSGRLDVGLASCRDVRSSPFAPAGTLCPAAFGGSCLSCENAVITERSLPAILLFCDHIEAQRRELAPAEWERRWLATIDRIRSEILPAFPEAVVEVARRRADSDPEMLYLPAPMTATSRR